MMNSLLEARFESARGWGVVSVLCSGGIAKVSVCGSGRAAHPLGMAVGMGGPNCPLCVPRKKSTILLM